MKLGINLTTADKIGLGVAGVVVWSIGILPTAIGWGILYYYRNPIKAYFLKRSVQRKVKQFLSYFWIN